LKFGLLDLPSEPEIVQQPKIMRMSLRDVSRVLVCFDEFLPHQISCDKRFHILGCDVLRYWQLSSDNSEDIDCLN